MVSSASIFSKVTVLLHKSLLPVYREKNKVLVSPEKPVRLSFQRALCFGKSIMCISVLYVHLCQRHLVKISIFLLQQCSRIVRKAPFEFYSSSSHCLPCCRLITPDTQTHSQQHTGFAHSCNSFSCWIMQKLPKEAGLECE